MSQRKLHLTVRWLLAIMVFATLHPALATVWGRHLGVQVAVCTSQGMRWVQLDERSRASKPSASETAPDSSSQAKAFGEHCPLCRVLADALPDGMRSDLRFSAPRAFLQVAIEAPQAPRDSAHLTPSAQPRAPPAFG